MLLIFYKKFKYRCTFVSTIKPTSGRNFGWRFLDITVDRWRRQRSCATLSDENRLHAPRLHDIRQRLVRHHVRQRALCRWKVGKSIEGSVKQNDHPTMQKNKECVRLCVCVRRCMCARVWMIHLLDPEMFPVFWWAEVASILAKIFRFWLPMKPFSASAVQLRCRIDFYCKDSIIDFFFVRL